VHPCPGASEKQRTRVANAARKLNEFRNKWLNPDDFMRTDIIELTEGEEEIVITC